MTETNYSPAPALEPLYQHLVSHAAHYALLFLSPEGRILTWNSGAEKMFGYGQAEAVGQNFEILFPPEDRELFVPGQELARALQTGRADNYRWLIKKDGTRLWAVGMSSRLLDKNGHHIGFSKLILEETVKKRTEEELKEVLANCTRFVAVASHELKDPLRTTASYLELLRLECATQLEANVTEFLRLASEGVGKMQVLIENLLSYSKVGMAKPKFEFVECNSVVDTVISNLSAPILEAGAYVVRSSLPTAWAVPTEMMELFQNLISNAIKYRRRGIPPKIKVDATETDQEVTFSISDNGIGISPEDHQRVFDEFQRVQSEREFPGTGLGLSICKKIAEHHSGKLWLESNIQHGTTFFFTIPKTQS